MVCNMSRIDTDDDWERERRLDIAFEQEPRPRSRRRRRFDIGARVRTARIGVEPVRTPEEE